jgi:Heterokaryon incompatibility protein (HET)
VSRELVEQPQNRQAHPSFLQTSAILSIEPKRSYFIHNLYTNAVMLCSFCSSIDLDQLSSKDGYKHHASVGDLLGSARNGCASCSLILDGQWDSVGGDLHLAYDRGPLETQIIARMMMGNEDDSIRYGQEARHRDWDSQDLPNREKLRPFLWSFLEIATKHGIYILVPFICVLTPADDPAATVVKTRALDERSLVHQISLASRWLKECLDNHAICLPEGKEIFDGPTRIINVGSSNGCSAPFLQTSNRDIHEWVALSHRWGNHQPLKTTIVNLATHESALPWEALPRLFQDAILITRNMGYRYLWIDSLCIVQDSPDDWRREVSRMGNIYKYCVFVISAECCRNSSESIFERSLVDKSAERVQQGCHSSQRNLRGALSVCSTRLGEKTSPGALQSRAWVLQEEILSPRTLRWSEDQLQWECRSTIRSEKNPIGSPTTNLASLQQQDWWKLVCLSKESLRTILHSQPSSKLSDPLCLWYGIIEDFCERQITFKTDTFPAISGIAREIGKHTSDEYHAGIWKEDFHNGLLWSLICTNPNSSTSSAPSWSWAILSNNLTTIRVFPAAFPPQHFWESYLEPIADLLAIDVEISGDDQFSQVRCGIIRLQAPYKNVTLFDIEKILLPDFEPFTCDYDNDDQPASYAIHHGTICCWLDHCKWGEESSLSAATKLHEKSAIFVQIGQGRLSTGDITNHTESIITEFNKSLHGQIWALVLEPTGNAVNEYMRLGIARVSEVLAEGWETQVISII